MISTIGQYTDSWPFFNCSGAGGDSLISADIFFKVSTAFCRLSINNNYKRSVSNRPSSKLDMPPIFTTHFSRATFDVATCLISSSIFCSSRPRTKLPLYMNPAKGSFKLKVTSDLCFLPTPHSFAVKFEKNFLRLSSKMPIVRLPI